MTSMVVNQKNNKGSIRTPDFADNTSNLSSKTHKINLYQGSFSALQ